MPPENRLDLLGLLRRYADSLTRNFSTRIAAQPEDQLKGPVQDLLRDSGQVLGFDVRSRTESRVEGLGGRPDIGVAVAQLPIGYVELKAPGKGAQPLRFTDAADKAQWKKFEQLPNVVYTDGSEWALYRTGERQGTVVRLSVDVTADGGAALRESDARNVERLLRDYFDWEPQAPGTPRLLAETLAPITRLLRQDVLHAMEEPTSNLSTLARNWRAVLFPDADDSQFADAYAQTVTYALLLARLIGEEEAGTSRAIDALESGHGLLAQALRVLADSQVREEIGLGIDLLERIIAAVDTDALTSGGRDPWLYFYEDFLAAYDPKLRNDRGAYYTPVEVVRAQTYLVSQLLREKFDKALAFADDGVVFLDPAVGTGAYPLFAMQHSLGIVATRLGRGAVAARASVMASNFHAFEILVGPYAVAHLRLTQQVQEAGGRLPPEGIHVYLTDTLESPFASGEPQLDLLFTRKLAEEHRRARLVKAETPVLVCIGNPPYDRQHLTDEETAHTSRKGGWVRSGDEHYPPILDDFLRPLRDSGLGVHAKNLYNDYVYFWRWALWKVFERSASGGIVSFISASSYLRGPGFVGMRKLMREMFDDLWIIDLEGGNLGARRTENVFAIQTPVAIAVGVRYGEPRSTDPARVHYTKIEGNRNAKLDQLKVIARFEDLQWEQAHEGWTEPFIPKGEGDFFSWPLLTSILPWQYSGVQFKRTWPIASTRDVLTRRWSQLMQAEGSDRGTAFRETGGRKIHRRYTELVSGERMPSIGELDAAAPAPFPERYAFRSFDRQWALLDPRLCDRIRPPLVRSHSNRQVYFTSLLSEPLAEGPALTATALVPDLHHFSGRGGADIIPMWRDAAGTEANINAGLLRRWSEELRQVIEPVDLAAYCYALLNAPSYTARFAEELALSGPRVPLTRSGELFTAATQIGTRLIHLHTFGERCGGAGSVNIADLSGAARWTEAIPPDAESYPDSWTYDAETETLYIGVGAVAPVSNDVAFFTVSGLHVLKSWLGYRMRSGAGRSSSPLDDVRPSEWTAELTEELLRVLWILERTVAWGAELDFLLERVVGAATLDAIDLPYPSEAEREPPSAVSEGLTRLPL